jgi:betaine-aldehyde dehydrogenase
VSVRQLIDGEWVEGRAGTSPCINPADGREQGEATLASVEQARAAIAAARAAFDRTAWARQPKLRAAALLGFADAVEHRRGEIEGLLVRFNGKLAREAANEVQAAISALRYYAGLARCLYGRIAEVDESAWSLLPREPAGVAAIIVPWNAPVSLMVRSLAPALAAGCTCVVKQALQTSPATSAVLECLVRTGSFPAGTVNAIVETGAECARAFCTSPQVDVISFTGSSETGKRIAASAAGTLKRLSLELGGKAPAIVFADSPTDRTLDGIVAGATVMCGQMCTAITRVLVEDRYFAEFAARLGERLAALVVGPGEEPASQMGPMIDRANRDRVAGLASECAQLGRVHLPATIPGGKLAEGAFLTPALVEVEDVRSNLVQEEVFGPLLALERFHSEDEAVERSNATRYGLAASVWSGDLQRAQRVAHRVRAGTVWLNAHNRHAPETETGGFRQSGRGRLFGLEALNDFLQTKHVYFEAGRA